MGGKLRGMTTGKGHLRVSEPLAVEEARPAHHPRAGLWNPEAEDTTMRKSDLDSLRSQLMKRRWEILRQYREEQEDIQSLDRNRSADWIDGARESTDAELLAVLSDRDRKEFEEVEGALLRIGEGTYGICRICRTPIDLERLKAIPHVDLCVTCKDVREGFEE